MKVKVQYLGLVKTYTNKIEDEITLEENATLATLLGKMAQEFGKQFKQDIYEPGMEDVKPMFMALINGMVIGQVNGTNTKLKDGDTVVLMPLVTGG